MRLELAEVALAVGGEIVAADPDARGVVVGRVTIDSRSIRPGDLFVPLVAERDGHAFVGSAEAAGATATLWGQNTEIDQSNVGIPRIVVERTDEALSALGRYARIRFGGPVVGITGSVGKTSAKDMLRGVIATTFVTSASERSHNNEIGVPLTLANIADDAQVAVIEMGARGPGHIRHLCEMASPNVGIVLCVAGAHLETFGSVQGVAAAKGELVECLDGDGVAVLNADDPLVAAMASRTDAEVLTFGSEGQVRPEGLVLGEDLRPSFRLCTPSGSVAVRLGVPGLHQVSNALAAAAAATWLGVSLESIAVGLVAVQLSPWRMELQRSRSGITILNDAYNANPTSTEAALRTFDRLAASRKVAVLGTMAELGEDSGEQHRAIGQLAMELGFEVIAVDAVDYGGPGDIDHVASVEEAAERLGGLNSADAVLLKGSRVAQLERLAQLLAVR